MRKLIEVPSREELSLVYRYDGKSGVLYKEEQPVGWKTPYGYLTATYKKQLYLVHRIIWQLVYGNLTPDIYIDHVNHIRDDNRIENLRIATHKENMKNKAIYKTNKSGFPGVTWHKNSNSWIVTIGVNGKQVTIRYSKDFNEAKNKRIEALNRFDFHTNHAMTVRQ